MSVRGPEVVDEPDSHPALDDGTSPVGRRRAVRSRRPMVAGAVAGLWALVVGVGLVTCLVMLAWAVSPNPAGDAAAAWRAAGLTWLGAHLVPLQVGGEPVTLLPIGGLLLGLLLARRSGAWAGRLLPEPGVGEVAWLVLGAGLLYGAGGAAVAWLSAAESASAQPAQAGAVTAAVAAAGALWGISREAGLVERIRGRISDAAWRTWLAGLAAVVGLFGAGAVLVTASLVRHFPEVAGTLSDLDPGVVGAAGVTLIDALSLPNLAIWAMAVIVGPGFLLGSTGDLSAFGGSVESLPALPVLAAIPTTVPGWAPVLLVVPVLLGVLAGRIRWGRDLPTASGALLGALGLAVVTAPLTAGILRLGSGSLGGDRLAQVGPVLVPVTAAATGLIVAGFLAEAGFQSVRLSWDLHRAERRAGALVATGQPEGAVALAAAESDAPAVPAEAFEPASEADATAAEATPSGGWVRGARAAVGRGVSGVSASAVSVVTGVGGAAMSVATGIGGAVTGSRSPGADPGPAEGDEQAPDPGVVDVREGAIDLREEGQPLSAGAGDSEPGEDGEVADAEPDSAADGKEADGEAATGVEADPEAGATAPAGPPDADEPAVVEDAQDPVPAAVAAAAAPVPSADDDTAEIPVISSVGGAPADPSDSRG